MKFLFCLFIFFRILILPFLFHIIFLFYYFLIYRTSYSSVVNSLTPLEGKKKRKIYYCAIALHIPLLAFSILFPHFTFCILSPLLPSSISSFYFSYCIYIIYFFQNSYFALSFSYYIFVLLFVNLSY